MNNQQVSPQRQWVAHNQSPFSVSSLQYPVGKNAQGVQETFLWQTTGSLQQQSLLWQTTGSLQQQVLLWQTTGSLQMLQILPCTGLFSCSNRGVPPLQHFERPCSEDSQSTVPADSSYASSHKQCRLDHLRRVTFRSQLAAHNSAPPDRCHNRIVNIRGEWTSLIDWKVDGESHCRGTAVCCGVLEQTQLADQQ